MSLAPLNCPKISLCITHLVVFCSPSAVPSNFESRCSKQLDERLALTKRTKLDSFRFLQRRLGGAIVTGDSCCRSRLHYSLAKE